MKQETGGFEKFSYQTKALLKNPWVKGVVTIGAFYGVLFISKYVIREYAEVVAATKKLRDAHRL
jgi:hypothetical protein